MFTSTPIFVRNQSLQFSVFSPRSIQTLIWGAARQAVGGAEKKQEDELTLGGKQTVFKTGREGKEYIKWFWTWTSLEGPLDTRLWPVVGHWTVIIYKVPKLTWAPPLSVGCWETWLGYKTYDKGSVWAKNSCRSNNETVIWEVGQLAHNKKKKTRRRGTDLWRTFHIWKDERKKRWGV